jgi:hypothetical protein
LDVVSEDRHAPFHHFVVFVAANTLHDPFLLLRDRQGVESGPHFLGNSNHVVNNDLIEEPHLATQFRHLEQIRIQSHHSIFDIVDSLLNENELEDGQNVDFNICDGLGSNRGLNDSGNCFEASSCCQLGLAVIVVIVSLFSIFIEQFEEQLRQVLNELQGKGPDFSSKILNNAFE